jgi:hypothetical protein
MDKMMSVNAMRGKMEKQDPENSFEVLWRDRILPGTG